MSLPIFWGMGISFCIKSIDALVNKQVKLLLKLGLTALALYLVYQKIDLQLVKEAFSRVHFGWLFLALLGYNASKVTSAFRLNHFFKSIELYISEKFNLRLYYKGMFYNLFLPGGIGGDGYKVFVLKKQHGKSVKSLISAALLDRLSGLAALCFLALCLFLFSQSFEKIAPYQWLVYLAIIGVYPTFYIGLRLFFKQFIGVFAITNLLSFLVQGIQILAAFFILLSLQVGDSFGEYLTLFLISSVVAAIPFTIGGIGAREIVFVYGNSLFGIETNTAVTFSVLFFLINALSAFIGAFLNIDTEQDHTKQKPQHNAMASSTL